MHDKDKTPCGQEPQGRQASSLKEQPLGSLASGVGRSGNNLRQQVNQELSKRDKILKNGQLFNAIRKKKTSEEKLRKIKKHLSEGADFNAQDANDSKNTPLHIAVLEGEPEIAKFLLDNGAIINHKNNVGETPLDIAELPDTLNGQKIFNILKAHSKSLSQASSQVGTLSKQQKEVKDKRKNYQSISDPNKRQKLDQNNSSQFVEKTLNQHDYQVWLTQEDFAYIAKNQYGWHGENDNVIFEVIGSVKQLNAQLTRYKEIIKVPGKQSLTFIINLSGNHWVTLVITHNNQQFSAYYVNSFGDEITSEIHDILNSAMPRIKISNPKFKQQEDDYNCGIFALENAKIINDVIKSGEINQMEQALVGYKPTSDDLKNKRKEFAEVIQDQKSKPEDSNQEKSRISSPDHWPMEVDQDTVSRNGSDHKWDEQNTIQNGRLREFISQNPKTHAAALGLKNTLHGDIYQLKLLMLFLKRGLKKGYFFLLATEMDAAEKFDDLVFQYENEGKNGKIFRFLQAKHKDKDNESKKISKNDLLTETDGDFSLQKYFISYRNIKEKVEFNKKTDALKDFVICTNIDLDDDLQSSFEDVTYEDDIIDTDVQNNNKKPKRLKLKKSDYLRTEVTSILQKASDLNKLAKKLAKYVSSTNNNDKAIDLRDGLFKKYHGALAEKVIDTQTKKFKIDFIEESPNLSEEVKKFRKALLEESKLLEVEFKRQLQDKNLKISAMFGNVLKLEENPEITEQLADKIVDLISDRNTNKIITIEKKACIIKENITKLVGHVFIKTDDNAIKVRQGFLDGDILPGNLNVFRERLKTKLSSTNKGIQFSHLGQYQFEINIDTCTEEDYEKYKKDRFYFEPRLPNDAVKIEEIHDFLDKLVFAVNQPNEVELGKIIESEIGDDINLIDSELVASKFQKDMLDWMKKKGGLFLTHEDGQEFFNKANQKISKLVLIGPTLEYRAKITNFGIEFREKPKELQEFLNSNDKQIFNLISSYNTIFGSIKVYQTLKNIQAYQRDDSYIFIRLSTLLSMQGRVIEAFNSEATNNLLVIDCEAAFSKNENIQELYKQLSKKLQRCNNKKIILITQRNNALVKKFKDTFFINNKYEQKKDEKNSLVDLTDDSQKKILKDEKVLFQGQEISLDKLIDEESKHLIDVEVLSKLINHQKIKIGKIHKNSRDEDYYIDRTFNRHIKIKEDFKEEESKFFIIEKDQDTKSNPQQKQDIVLISDKEEDFKELCDKYKKRSIHWLKYEIDEYIWQQSHGVLSKLRKFVDKSGQNPKEYKPKKITDIHDRIVIIAAEPGMGKSTVLTPLALKTIESDPSSLWVVRINLLDQSSQFKKWKDHKTKINESEALGFLHGAMDFLVFTENGKQTKKNRMINNLKNNTSRKIKGLNLLKVGLFNQYYNKGKIALLFDGFDEISPDYKDQVIKLLKFLKGTKAEKIWLTTRPYNIQGDIENALSTFSYALRPFVEVEQRHFLKKFWKYNLELRELDEKRSEVFIGELLDRFSKSINDEGRGFVGIPLLISMIAEVFQDMFEEIYNSKSHELFEKHKKKLSEMLNLATIYERFIIIKFYKILCSDKNPGANTDDPHVQDINKGTYKKIIEVHRTLALFEDNKLRKLLSQTEINQVKKEIKKIKQQGERTGIIDKINYGNPHFIHHTFAEYFVASYFWEKFKSITFDDFGKDFIQTIIIKNLIKDDRIQICKFFQSEAKEDLEKNVFISEKEDKLKMLLKALVNNIKRYGPLEKKNSKQSTKLLLKIIEFSLPATEGIIRDVVQGINDDKILELLSVSAEMGYKMLADALITVAIKQLNTHLLQTHLKRDKWYFNPVWLAAENRHEDVVQILIEKLSYDVTWKDKEGKSLLFCILQVGKWDVLRSCLKVMNIVRHEYIISLTIKVNGEEMSLKKACIKLQAPLDVIELLQFK